MSLYLFRTFFNTWLSNEHKQITCGTQAVAAERMRWRDPMVRKPRLLKSTSLSWGIWQILLLRQICRCGWQGPERERYYFCEKFIAEHSTWPRRKLVTSSWLGIPQQTTRRAIDINIVVVIMDESRLNFCYLFRNVQLVPKV